MDIQQVVQQGHFNRLKEVKRRLDEEETKQHFSGVVVGYEDGSVLVSVNQGGALKARGLSNGNFGVGDIVSYFRPSNDSIGFVDKMPSG